MTKVITVTAQKGGAGKTTLSINLAASLAGKGYKVLLADADEQQSAAAWHSLAAVPGFDVYGYPESLDSLPDDAASFDFCVIDCQPRAHEKDAQAMEWADLALIPMQASAVDYWAAEATFNLVRHYVKANKITAAVVPSRVQKSTKMAQELLKTLRDESGIEVYPGLSQLQAFVKAMAAGKTVLDDKESKAAAQIRVLTNHVLKVLEK